MSRESRVVAVMLRLADTLVSDFELTDLFYELVDTSKELLDISEAGLLLAENGGSPRVVAATSEAAHFVELMELESEGGPGKETFHSGQPVTSGPLDEEPARDKWPKYSAQAQEVGFTRCWAFPLRLRDQVIGALNLLHREEREMSDEDFVLAGGLADMTTIAILQHRLQRDERLVIAQLQTALESRVVIEQAKGIIAQEANVDMDQAFSHLRAYARRNNLRLRGVAASVIAGDLAASELTQDR